MKVTILVVALAVLAGVLGQTDLRAQSEAEKAAIEQEALKVMAAIEQAAERADASSFSDLVLPTDKGAVILNGKLFLTREEAQSAVEKSYQAVSKQDMTIRHHVTVLSPTAVLVVSDGEGRVTLADGSQFGPIPFAQTVVLVLRGGQWKVLHAHSSAIRPQ